MRHNEAVETTIERLTGRLEQNEIPYALIGAMAMAAHGHWRFTTAVDVLTTPEGLDKVHARLGYVPAVPGARKAFRDTVTNVIVEFITTGEYPGDGKPKSVRFPHPKDASITIDGTQVLSLAKLLELKIASGLTAPHRLKDLADAQELINRLKPPRTMGEDLDPFVRDEFYRMWDAAQNAYDPSAG